MRDPLWLPVEERKRLISLIVDTLVEPERAEQPPRRSILDYEGVGAELWAGVDVPEYLARLRDEWDRPQGQRGSALNEPARSPAGVECRL